MFLFPRVTVASCWRLFHAAFRSSRDRVILCARVCVYVCMYFTWFSREERVRGRIKRGVVRAVAPSVSLYRAFYYLGVAQLGHRARDLRADGTRDPLLINKAVRERVRRNALSRRDTEGESS